MPGIPSEFFVAPHGNDSNEGSACAPFATLERARDQIRASSASAGLPEGGVTVWIRGGVYQRQMAFELTEEDSGKESSPITYRAWPGESARIIGGVMISHFSRVDDASVRERLQPSVRDRVLSADLSKYGVTDYGRLTSRGFARPVLPAHAELFVEGEPMTLAQWPQSGEFLKIAGFGKPLTDEWGTTTGDLTGGFTYQGDRPLAWEPDDDIWVHGYWSYDWANSYERVRHIDPHSRTVTTHPPHGNYSYRVGQRFYFLNVLEELDAPGEYYVDRRRGRLYLLPPDEQEVPSDVILSVLEAPLVAMQRVSHVSFDGLTLECSRGDGLVATDCEHVSVRSCTIKNLGNRGIVIRGGRNVAVAGCTVFNNGDGGLDVEGGDRQTLEPADHVVVNNHIHHIARWSRCYQTAVNVHGVGHLIAHNLIHDLPHCAILFWGNEITIENNEIYSVCLETGDAGAIYTGRDYTFRGNVIRRNFIHHTGGVGMGSMAVYMDDCVSGTTICENIFWDVTRAVFLGGGRDLVVRNNVFVDCHPAIELDSRGTSDHPVWRRMVMGYMKEQYEKMRPSEPPYRLRYPELAAIEPYFSGTTGVPAEGNVITHNVCLGEWVRIDESAAPLVEIRDNFVDVEPAFCDPSYGVFAIEPDSPLLKAGFDPIPVEEIGLVRNAVRTSIPPRVGTKLEHVHREDGDGVRVSAKNLADTPAEGSLRFRVHRAGEPELYDFPEWEFTLLPGETASSEFSLEGINRPVTIEAHSQVPGVRPSRLTISLET